MSKLRRRAYEILENPAHDLAGRRLNGLLIALIIANVAAIILGSVHSINSRYKTWFEWFEWFSILLFTFEYLRGCGQRWSATTDATRHRSRAASATC